MAAKTRLVAVGVAGVLALAGGCNPTQGGGGDGGAEAGVDPYVYRAPAVPTRGTLLETAPFTVGPGEEVIMCTFTNIRPGANLDTRELHSYQMPGGHHLLLMYTTRTYPLDTHPCTEAEMADLRIVGGGDSSHEQALTLPDGLGIRIPAGAQLALQAHYINTDTAAHTVKDAMVVVQAAPGVVTQTADAFAISDSDMMIPPRAQYGRTVECLVDQEMNMVQLLGHTHQYGTHILLSVLRAGGSTPEVLYDEVAGARLMSNPPIRRYTPQNPLAFHPGDRVRLSCDWNNTSTSLLGFPQEMCVGFGYYYPANGFVACGNLVETRGGGDAGVMSTNGNAGCSTPWSAGMPCVRSCNTGNELGVGRSCTAGGGECTGNRSAIICTADVDPSSPGFCTRGCNSSAGCGSGAMCTGDSRGMGCVPNECVDPPDGGSSGDASTPDAAPSDAASRTDASAG